MAENVPEKVEKTLADETEVSDAAGVDSSVSAADQTTLIDSGEPKALLAGIPIEFGRYRLVQTIGEGGMGCVYLAHDTQLDRQVALKVPRFRSDQDPSALKRFLREARAAALLRHPHICPIYDVGDINGTHFLTMAFIEGQTLTEHTHPEKLLPQREVAALLSKIARAMHEAHVHNIVHRDLKPANIMIDVRGEPAIMDFGLARHDRPGDEALTQEGAVMGTPAYMSPEQVEGDADQIGPATDIYSLGVVLFELLTGRRPFAGSVASLMAQVLRDEPPALSSLRYDVEPLLELICEKSLAKRPENRYGSALEMAEAIDRFLSKAATSSDRLTIRGGPKVIEAPSEPIETYGLSGITEQETSESETHDPAAEELRVARISTKIQKLLGESKLAQALIDIASLPDSKERAERMPLIVERCRKRVARLIEDDQHAAAITTAAALHIAGSVPETLDELIETAEAASQDAWNPDEPRDALSIWGKAVSFSPKDKKLRRRAAMFANKRAMALSQTGKLSEAIVVYRQAVKWDDSPVLQKNLLSAYRKLAASAIDAGQRSRAEKICTSGLAFSPDDPILNKFLNRARKPKK